MRAKTRENAPKTPPVWLPVDYPILPSVPCLLPCSARCPISGGWSTRHPATAVPVEVPVTSSRSRSAGRARGRGRSTWARRGAGLRGQFDPLADSSIHVGAGEVWLPKCQFDLLAVDPRGRGLGVRRVGQFDLPLTLVDPRGRGLGARQCLQRPRYGLRADRVALGPGYRQKRQRITASATAETIMPVMQTTSGPAGGSSGAKVMAVTRKPRCR